jgi:hypothetical protein
MTKIVEETRDGVLHRRCNGCKDMLPLTEDNFYRARQMPRGFEYRCKPCERDRARWRNMLRLYNLTPDTYKALLKSQNGVCAVCKQLPNGGIVAIDGKQLLDIDHDHVEGHVRGLLCRSCNLILGRVNDDPVRLRNLADYLERNTRP